MNIFSFMEIAEAISGQKAPKEAWEIAANPQRMTAEQWLERQVAIENQTEGTLTDYDCDKCKNRGSFAAVKDGYYVTIPCECQTIRDCIRRARLSGLEDALKEKTFESYRTETDWQKKAVEMCKQFCTDKSPTWLYFGGQNGCGKTHLCTAICGELINQKRDVLYVSWVNVYRKFCALRFKETEFSEEREKLVSSDVLYIDDFLKCKDDSERIKMLTDAFDIINERAERNKKTIISSEMFIDEISALDEAIAGRIVRAAWNYRIQIKRDDSRNFRKNGGAKYEQIL